MSWWCRKHSAWLLALAAMGQADPLVAAEWEVVGKMGSQFIYDDNITMNALQPKSAWGFAMLPNVQARRKTADWSVSLGGNSQIERYPDFPDWDIENYGFTGESQYKMTNTVLGFRGYYNSTASRFTQLNTATTTAGLGQTGTRRIGFGVGPSIQWRLTPLETVGMSVNFAQTEYDQATQTSTNNGNVSYGVNLQESHQWSRRLTSNSSFGWTKYEFDGNPVVIRQQDAISQFVIARAASGQVRETQLYNLQAGLNYRLSQLFRVGMSFGGRLNETPSGSSGNIDRSMGYTGSANLAYSDENDTATVSFTKSMLPSPIGGTLVDTISFRASLDHRFTQRLVLSVNGGIQNIDVVNQQGVSQVRNFYTSSVEGRYALSREWQLSAAYRYRQQTLESEGLLADSNSFILSLQYNWDGWRVSR